MYHQTCSLYAHRAAAFILLFVLVSQCPYSPYGAPVIRHPHSPQGQSASSLYALGINLRCFSRGPELFIPWSPEAKLMFYMFSLKPFDFGDAKLLESPGQQGETLYPLRP